jgi:hypothetical protein
LLIDGYRINRCHFTNTIITGTTLSRDRTHQSLISHLTCLSRYHYINSNRTGRTDTRQLRISQTVPKFAKKMTKKSAAQEILFLGKIGFLKPCAQTCPKNDKEIRAQEILFLGKIGFLKPCAQTCPKNDKEIRCPRNPIFGKNRISQTVCPNVPKKKKSAAQEILFLGKIGFLKPCPNVPKKKKSAAQEIRFFWKNRISFEKTEFINGLDIGAILH